MVTTSGCSPDALKAIAAGAAGAAPATTGTAVPAKSADPAKPATPADPAKPANPAKPATPADPAKPATPADPAKPAGGSDDDKVKDAYFEKFKAKVEAAKADPEKTLKLFIAAYAQYDKDAQLSKELMTLFMEPFGGPAGFGDVERDPISRSGLRFAAVRNNYWREMDKNTKLVLIHLKNASDADSENPEDSVLIDYDYKAADIGVNGDSAKFYLFINPPNGKRSRPVKLRKVNGAWRVQEFSSITIQI